MTRPASSVDLADARRIIARGVLMFSSGLLLQISWLVSPPKRLS